MTESLSTPRAAALYIGALLGPGLLLLPGLAARIAGPASILAWLGLLVLSALFAVVFTSLGVRFGSRTGVAGYVSAGVRAAGGTGRDLVLRQRRRARCAARLPDRRAATWLRCSVADGSRPCSSPS